MTPDCVTLAEQNKTKQTNKQTPNQHAASTYKAENRDTQFKTDLYTNVRKHVCEPTHVNIYTHTYTMHF